MQKKTLVKLGIKEFVASSIFFESNQYKNIRKNKIIFCKNGENPIIF